MNGLMFANRLFSNLPLKSMIRGVFFIVLVTKVFHFNVELGDWGKSALNFGMSQYKSVMANSPLKGEGYGR
jgi:hypothetical protein